MTEAEPFSRVVRVDALPREGQTVTIEASPAEREALASFYKLPAIEALTATLRARAAGTRRRARDGRGPRRTDPDLRRLARAVRGDGRRGRRRAVRARAGGGIWPAGGGAKR